MMRNKTKACIRLSLAVLLLCGAVIGSVRADTITSGNASTLEVKYLENSQTWQITPNTDTVSANSDALVTSKDVYDYVSGLTGGTVGDSTVADSGKLVTGQAVYDYLHQNEVELGVDSTAWGRNSVALGASSNAYGKGSVALGYLTKAGTSETNADDVYATALGYFAYAQAPNSVAVGDAYVEAYANQGIAIGKYAKALETNAVAIGGNAIEGESAVARGISSVAIGDRSKAEGKESLALGYYAYALASGSVAVGDCYVSADANQGVAIGKYSKALATNAVAIGGNENEEAGGAYAKGWSAVALGDGSKAYGKGSVALGYGAQAGTEEMISTVSGEETITDVETEVYATAIGYHSKASGKFGTAVGHENTVTGESAVVLGSENTIGGNATIAIGKKIHTSAQNAVVIGGGTDSEITAVADNSVVLGYGSTSEEADTVSVGSATQQRKIVHVADGEADTDAVNVGQLKDAMNENRNEMGRALGTLDSRVNDVAAGAAALAALHPTEYNPENKASFAVGYGHYRNANAGAFGAFFMPNEDVTVSLASTIGNGNPMLNAGVSFKLGKRGNAIYAKQDSRIIQKLVTENAEQAKKIETLEADNAQMKAQIAEILKKLEMAEKR